MQNYAVVIQVVRLPFRHLRYVTSHIQGTPAWHDCRRSTSMQYERPAVEYLEPLICFIYLRVCKFPTIPESIDRRVLKLTNYFDSQQAREHRYLENLCKELCIAISAYRASRLFHQSIGIAVNNYIATKRFLHSLAD